MTSRTSAGLCFAPAIVLAALVAATPARAQSVAYAAELKGANQVPPRDVSGTGWLTAAFDAATKKLTYTVTYSGLTGVATSAYFHGPAAANANAPVVLAVRGSTASPIKGEAILTDGQIADLADGKIYFNIHTSAHPGGEIRGQVLKK